MKLLNILLIIMISIYTTACSNFKLAEISPTLNFEDERVERNFIEAQIKKNKLVRSNRRKTRTAQKMICEISRTAGLKKCVQAYFIEDKERISPSAGVNTIIIPSGTLALGKENLYFILAHEVSHIALGHTKKRSKYNLENVVKKGLKTHEKVTILDKKNLDKGFGELKKQNSFVQLLAGIYGSYAYSYIVFSELAVYAFDTGFYYAFSKRQEYQADISSIYIMKKNHISTDGVVPFLWHLSYRRDAASEKVLLGNTHPMYKDRIKNIEKNGGKPVDLYIDDESLTEVGSLYLLLKLFGF